MAVFGASLCHASIAPPPCALSSLGVQLNPIEDELAVEALAQPGSNEAIMGAEVKDAHHAFAHESRAASRRSARTT